MAVDSAALNLAQYAALSNDPLVTAVTFSLIKSGNVMQDVPFVNKASLKVNGSRWEGNLPAPNYVALNQEGVTVSSSPTPYSEQVFIMRNNIDTDKLLVEDINSIGDPRGQQLQAYLVGATYDLNDKFINNDHASGDSNAPVGLKSRIDNGALYGVRAANKIDAGGVDVSQATGTAATGNKFFELLDQLLWSVDSVDGTGVVLYMNEALKRRLAYIVRLMGTSGGWSITQDQFGRTVDMFRGAVIRDIGYKSDQATRIITTTELANGSAPTGATFTSIYAVNYGMDHFYGWQFAPLAAHDLGLLNNGMIYRTFVDWAAGLVNASNRSLARLYDIKYS